MQRGGIIVVLAQRDVLVILLAVLLFLRLPAFDLQGPKTPEDGVVLYIPARGRTPLYEAAGKGNGHCGVAAKRVRGSVKTSMGGVMRSRGRTARRERNPHIGPVYRRAEMNSSRPTGSKSWFCSSSFFSFNLISIKLSDTAIRGLPLCSCSISGQCQVVCLQPTCSRSK
eukprot:248886-Prymnesium_polylepis.1